MTDSQTISFESEGGSDVTVTAEKGVLQVALDGSDCEFETTATLTTEQGRHVLDCGVQSDDNGERFRAFIPVGELKDDIAELREDSKSDEPLTYEVEEYTETSRAGGWGKQKITKQRLVPNLGHSERSEREQELSRRVNTDRPPEDAEPGDTYTLEDLLEDPRTSEERDQDALKEAAESGEGVVISESTTRCNDASKECNLDHVTRVATPEGEVETRRTHTY